jgi:hypothetical protein
MVVQVFWATDAAWGQRGQSCHSVPGNHGRWRHALDRAAIIGEQSQVTVGSPTQVSLLARGISREVRAVGEQHRLGLPELAVHGRRFQEGHEQPLRHQPLPVQGGSGSVRGAEVASAIWRENEAEMSSDFRRPGLSAVSGRLWIAIPR